MNPLLILPLTLMAYMTAWFFISIIKKRNDLADVAWGIGFILVAWLSYYLFGNNTPKALLASILVTIWGLRLSTHIYLRNLNKTEDYRYLAWRKQWGKLFYLRSLFQIYWLQGILLLIISAPIVLISSQNTATIGVLDIVGTVIWTIGFCFEVIGDWQLAVFMKQPENKGKLMRSGLWAYSRHPNYFGEVTQWWGLWILALSSPHAWITIVGPMTITFLILKVSGVPMLEKKLADHLDFAAYKHRVSKFIPMLPKGK